MQFHFSRKWAEVFFFAIIVVTGLLLMRVVNDLKAEIEANRRGPACVITLLLNHRTGTRSADQQIAEALGIELIAPEGIEQAIPKPKDPRISKVCKHFIEKDLPEVLDVSITNQGGTG